jgi:hypothetical protein
LKYRKAPRGNRDLFCTAKADERGQVGERQ